MPFLKLGCMPRTMLDITVSCNDLDKNYHEFGNIDTIKLYIDYKTTHVIGLDNGVVVLKLNFKIFNALPIVHNMQDVIQVTKVAILASYEGKGIISQVYNALVSNGFTTVADSTQFEPAKLLWKKLANTSKHVYVITNKGKVMPYTGTNISDNQIWSSGLDQSGYGKMLVMTANQL